MNTARILDSTTPDMGDHPTYTVVYLQAATGSVRAARSVASKALREVGPQSYGYQSADECKAMDITGPRYTAYMTRAQFREFEVVAARIARESGFDEAPLDCYQD